MGARGGIVGDVDGVRVADQIARLPVDGLGRTRTRRHDLGGDGEVAGPDERLEAARGVAHRCSDSFSAAVTVFSRSIAVVIGPTPPGTGVIIPATSLTSSKSTSPTRPCSVR